LLYDLAELEDELAKLKAERGQLTPDTRENIRCMDSLDASISQKTSLIAEKNSARDRARNVETARIEEAKEASEARESMHRAGLALVTAAALGPVHINAELAKLGPEVGQFTLAVVAQRLETRCKGTIATTSSSH
jgi:hypothetical protein